MNQPIRNTILTLAAIAAAIMPVATQAAANYDLVPAVNDTTLYDVRDYTCVGVSTGADDGTTTGPSGPVSKKLEERQTFAFLNLANKFLGEGATAAQARAWAAGIVGNLSGESSVDPTSDNPAATNGGGGIAQWEGARWSGPNGLLAYAKKKGTSWKDFNTQLDFLWWELHHNEKGALTALKKTTTAGAAAVSFLLKFERPSIPRTKVRVDYANAVFAANASKVLDSSPSAGTPTRPTGTPADDTTDTSVPCGGPDPAAAEVPSGTGGSNTAACPKLSHISDNGIQKGYLNGKETPVRICIVYGVDVNTRIAKGFHDLYEAAKAAGYNFSGSGGFRTMKEQTDLYNSAGCPNHCSKPVATPGHSNHQMGLAIDFAGIGKVDPGNPKFKWLKAHAKGYGLINYPKESWHWSINGK